VRGPQERTGRRPAKLFGFLTTEANAVVARIHPKAMPVILTKAEEVNRWLLADPPRALELRGLYPTMRSRSSPAARKRTERRRLGPKPERLSDVSHPHPRIVRTLKLNAQFYPLSRSFAIEG
jgi:putative SOS response-associated peptidase YedK